MCPDCLTNKKNPIDSEYEDDSYDIKMIHIYVNISLLLVLSHIFLFLRKFYDGKPSERSHSEPASGRQVVGDQSQSKIEMS